MILMLLSFQPNTVHAQYDDIGIFLRAGTDDAEALVKAYLEPLASGVGAGLNTGWFTQASAHKTLGFSIQIRGSLAFIPEAGQQFDISELSLNNVRAADQSNTVSPTIGGIDEAGPEVVVSEDGQELARFNLPRGSGFHIVPAPMVQASVGLIKNTDVTVRFVPEVEIGDYGTFKMLGVGLRHEISQYFPGIIPVDISIMAGYNTIDLSAGLNLNPQSGSVPDPDEPSSYDNQQALTSFDTFTVKIIVGKSLPLIDIYAAAGYETSTMTVALTGNYPVPVPGPAGVTRTETVTDPFEYSQDGENTFSLTAGATLKLLFFDIFAQYTLSKYPVLNAGIGFSFR